MSLMELNPGSDLTCRDCGATNDPGASECWLCQRRDWRRDPDSRPKRTVPPPRVPLSSNARWVIVIALIAVVLGVFLLAPGLGIALLIFGLPAWAITEAKASRRRRDQPMSGMEKTMSIIGWTLLIPILLIAVLIALCLACAGAIALFSH